MENNSLTEQQLNEMASNLHNFVDFGLKILEEIIKKPTFYTPLITNFNHFLDFLDAVAIMIEKGSSYPVELLLRNLFETNLTIDFIVSENTNDKIKAYEIAQILEKIDMLKQKGKFCNEDKVDSLLNIEDLNNIYCSLSLQDSIDKLEAVLKLDEYSDLALVLKKQSSTKWYRSFGPRNLKEMASLLNKSAFYEIYYHEFSQTVHSKGSLSRIKLSDNGELVISSLRDSTNIDIYYKLTTQLAVDTFAILIKFYDLDFEC
jgi:hypothetical protein